MKNLLVFFGGLSSEHDISVITGLLALNGTDKSKFNAIPIYIDKEGLWYTGKTLYNIENYKNLNYKNLSRVTLKLGENVLYKLTRSRYVKICEISLAVNCLHGMYGEDGTLSGIMSTCKIPLASPDVLGASVSMDKAICKDVAKSHAIKTLPYVSITDGEFFGDRKRVLKSIYRKLNFPIILKPTRLGSSIGINIATDEQSLINGIYDCLRYDRSCIAERKLQGFTELNCACYKGLAGYKVSNVEIAETQNEILTFGDKYQDGNSSRKKYTDDEKIIKTVKSYTLRLYKTLKLKGVCRADYLVKDGTVYFNEINTVPGSLAYYFYCDTLEELPNFLNEIYQVALEDFNKEQSLSLQYDSDILKLNGVKTKGVKQ